METTTIEAMETQNTSEVCCDTVQEQLNALTQAQLRWLELGKQNHEDIEAIQEVISMEEGEYLGTEEVLSRVLSFYNRFVPFRGAV